MKDPELYAKTFADIHPALTPDEAAAESSRCLFCFDAPCIAACPTHIDIPGFIKKIATRNVKGSARTIFDSNMFGASCARVCPVEALCEGACVMNDLHRRPIEIGRLQRFATDWWYERDVSYFKPGPPTGKKVAVIGGGPAGLSCAAELRRLGHAVTVFEARRLLGGLNTYGIAEYKMNKDVSLREIKQITDLGVEVKTGTPVDAAKLAELEKRFDAVFLGVGLGKVEDLGVPGEGLPGVRDALDFIEEIKMAATSKSLAGLANVAVGKRVAVIGAGNTAVDAATQAKRLGASWVAMVYRRSEKEMPAYEYEYALAKGDEVVLYWQTAPRRILGKTGVEALECVKMRLGEPDDSGRRRPEPIPGSEFTLPVDMVIKAIGQKKSDGFFSTIPGVKVERGLPVVDRTTCQTTNPKYFAGGDGMSGGAEVVNAVAEGKRAARGIHAYLGGT